MSGNGKQGYCIKFDDLTADNHVVCVCRRDIITVVNEGEEEVDVEFAFTLPYLSTSSTYS